MSLIESRIMRFQELISKGKIYKLMNFNLYILRRCFQKGNGKFVKLTEQEYSNFWENYVFYGN